MKVRTFVMVALLVAAACGGRTPTTPSSQTTGSAPPPPPAGGQPKPEPVAFEMSGVVTDDTGAAVSGARVTVWLDAQWGSVPPVVATDPMGRYRVSFSAVPGSGYYPRDPPGISQAVGYLDVEAPGFERLARYILGTAPQLVENVRVHRVRRITAGESATVTMTPDDTVCIIDGWPGRELICGIVHVVPPTDGTLLVEAVSTDGGSAHPGLWVWGLESGNSWLQNPALLPAVAGREYFVNVQLPWGFGGTQSFVVKTSYVR